LHTQARIYIKKLRLKKHPEGGYYREVYRSGEKILPAHLPKRYKSSRNFSTSIYFLLEGKQFSAFHLLQSDELWHFYDGSDLKIYIINPKGELTIKKLGRSDDAEFQIAIEKHCWFAAEVDNKKLFSLLKKFSRHRELIHRLTSFLEYDKNAGRRCKNFTSERNLLGIKFSL
jgi:predicted cupin superfamily sugar epimerase